MSKPLEYAIVSVVAIGLFVGLVNLSFLSARSDFIEDCKATGFHRMPTATVKCEVLK